MVSAFAFALGIDYLAVGQVLIYDWPGGMGWYGCCVAAPIAMLLVAGPRRVMPRWKAAAVRSGQ